MTTQNKQLFLAISAVAVLSIGIYNAPQLSTLQSTADQLLSNHVGAQNDAAGSASGEWIKVAGNAPCNPEQEVCNK